MDMPNAALVGSMKSPSTILKAVSPKVALSKTGNETVGNDKKAWNMEDLEPNDRLIWRKGIQSAIQMSNPQREWKK